jgi:hypothetical protein
MNARQGQLAADIAAPAGVTDEVEQTIYVVL